MDRSLEFKPNLFLVNCCFFDKTIELPIHDRLRGYRPTVGCLDQTREISDRSLQLQLLVLLRKKLGIEFLKVLGVFHPFSVRESLYE